MKTDQLNGLIALKAVADHRNFTLAAETLGVSPSAISQSVKQLETRLGVALLSRTTRSTTLTEVGEKFLNQAGPALDQILTAMESVGSYAAKPSGVLRLNLPKILYSKLIGPLVTSFVRKFPEVTVELFFDEDLSDVVAKGFDAGIRLSELTAVDMVVTKLMGPIKFVVVGSPKYFQKKGRPKHPKDLVHHNCFRIRFGERGLYDRWEFENRGKDFQIAVKGSLIMNDNSFIMDAVLNGAGLTYTVEELIRDKIEAGKLEVVLNDYAPKSDGFFLYYPTRSQVQPKLRAFLDHLKAENHRF